MGAAGVGVAQAALDLALHRLRTRKAFGGPLSKMQYWQFKMAERAAEPEAAMAKAYGARVAVDTVRDTLQIHGGFGFARQIGETGSRFDSRNSTATRRY
nr:acyl-CoA dehydrogenase family protein [Mycobacterium paraintracellulare]